MDLLMFEMSVINQIVINCSSNRSSVMAQSERLRGKLISALLRTHLPDEGGGVDSRRRGALCRRLHHSDQLLSNEQSLRGDLIEGVVHTGHHRGQQHLVDR